MGLLLKVLPRTLAATRWRSHSQERHQFRIHPRTRRDGRTDLIQLCLFLRGKEAQRGSETSPLLPSRPAGEPAQFLRVLTQHFLPCCQAKADGSCSAFGVPRAHPRNPPHCACRPSLSCGALSRTEVIPATACWLPLELVPLGAGAAVAWLPGHSLSPLTLLPLSAKAPCQSFTPYFTWE